MSLPLVLPRIWADLLAGLRDDAVQWTLTVIAAILSYAFFVAAQWFADSTIQSLVQTHPDQFPGAQRVLTAIFAVYGWIAGFYLIMMLATLFAPMVKMRSTDRPYLSITAALAVFFALSFIPLTVFATMQRAIFTDEHGHRARQGMFEKFLILGTSFMRNQVVEGVLRNTTGEYIQQTRLVCRNLSPDVDVAFVHPDKVVPDKVIVAEPRSDEIPEGAPAYRYRLSACENSNNPDGIQ